MTVSHFLIFLLYNFEKSPQSPQILFLKCCFCNKGEILGGISRHIEERRNFSIYSILFLNDADIPH